MGREVTIEILGLPHDCDPSLREPGFDIEGEYIAVRREQIIEEDYQREHSILRMNIERKDRERKNKLLADLDHIVAGLEKLTK